MEPITKVLFRVDDAGDVLAVFPEVTEGPGRKVSCYARVGQHSCTEHAYVRESTRPATEAEYAALKRELESAPYGYRFKVIKRWPSRS